MKFYGLVKLLPCGLLQPYLKIRRQFETYHDLKPMPLFAAYHCFKPITVSNRFLVGVSNNGDAHKSKPRRYFKHCKSGFK
jgi:hypothetical protein